MSKDFVHYHNHSEYSALDGISKVKDMAARAKELGHTAIGLTDHGNMCGLLAFNAACKDVGIKPLLGIEFYTTPLGYSRTERVAYGRERAARPDEQHRNNYHLIALAMDTDGFHNLCRLTTASFADGYYYKPRIDFELLQEHSKGLLVTSACLAGEVNHWLKLGNYEKAREVASAYKDVFGENYYLETMYSDVPEQKFIIPQIARLGKELGIKVTQANDAHYVNADDAETQNYWLLLSQAKSVGDPSAMQMGPEYYLKDYDAMLRAVGDPEALANTMEIAEKCNVELGGKEYKIPVYDVATDARFEGYCTERLPELGTTDKPIEQLTTLDIDHRDYLHWMCMETYERLVMPGIKDDPEKQKEYMDRLDYELDVVGEMGFIDYFLIVQDYVNYARDNGMPTGPGRGSAAGSLVSYLAGITRVDPIPYGLYFERFLNPERIGMPDIDVDFPQSKRQEIMEYVRNRYTPARAAQVMTFGYERPKGSIKDMARVLGFPPNVAEKITKTISDDLKATIDSELAIGGDFSRMYHGDPDVKRIVDVAKKVEGLVRGDSIHASAFVIAPHDIADFMPMQTPKGQQGTMSADDTASFLVQYDGTTVEKLGYLKMDFLGLGNLDALANTQRLIKKIHDVDIELENIPFDDKKTLSLLRRGETAGLFQVESPGMIKTLKQVLPTKFSEIADIIALYRPGPMDYIPAYVEGKQHPESIQYLDPRLKPILEETYNVAVYQESLMQISRSIAGFSLAEADTLRKAIGKKKMDVLAGLRDKFFDGCRASGTEESTAESLWALMEAAASYSFNKAHAVAYAFLAWYTAYFKANYPAEFMCSMMSYRKDHPKAAEYLDAFFKDCHRYEVAVLPPHVNRSGIDFDVAHPMEISFGLAALKGIGEGPASYIVEEREKSGPYKDLNDFLARMDPKAVNSGVIAKLATSGALDGLGWTRKALTEEIERIKAFMNTMKTKSKHSEDQGTFDFFGEIEIATIQPETTEEYQPDELLETEKKELGFYLTGNPLEYYEISRRLQSRHLPKAKLFNISDLHALEDKDEVHVFGVVSRLKRFQTQKGDFMAFVTLSDFGKAQESVHGYSPEYYDFDCVVFPKAYEAWGHRLREGDFLKVRGNIKVRQDDGRKSLAFEEVTTLRKDSQLDRDEPALASILEEIERDMAEEYARWSQPAVEGSQRLEIEMSADRAAEFLAVVDRFPGTTPATLIVEGRRKELGGVDYNAKLKRLLVDFLEAKVRMMDAE